MALGIKDELGVRTMAFLVGKPLSFHGALLGQQREDSGTIGLQGEKITRQWRGAKRSIRCSEYIWDELVPVAMYENMASVLQRTDLGQVRASPIALAGCLPCRRARPTVDRRIVPVNARALRREDRKI